MSHAWLRPRFETPGVAALMTTREGGVSGAPYASLNLGIAVGDAPADVERNRARFAQAIGGRPVFLKQVHGTTVLELAPHSPPGDAAAPPEADASMTTHPGVACVVQVADCMPVLFAAPGGVAAAHAGWRGLAGGVLERTVEALRAATGCAAGDIEAWFGPCIGPRRFEVGADVLRASASGPNSRGRASCRTPRASGWPTSPGSVATGLPRWGSPACTAGSGARSRTTHGSSRSGATASPAAWLRRSGSPPEGGCCGASCPAISRWRRARRRAGVPSK